LKRGADLPLDAPLSVKKMRPIAFCRTKAAMMREITERSLTLTAAGATLIDGLPPTFGRVIAADLARREREEADKGGWLDE
jgi:hypothetical protein